jgi:hypothetical protein
VAIKATLLFLFCPTNCAAIDNPDLWKTRHKAIISRHKDKLGLLHVALCRWGLNANSGILERDAYHP